jgi:hypothetical protein
LGEKNVLRNGFTSVSFEFGPHAGHAFTTPYIRREIQENDQRVPGAE